MIVDKRVKMQLVGIDGNAFSIMGVWQRNARRQGWTKEEIDKVLNECTTGAIIIYSVLSWTIQNSLKSQLTT